MKSNQASSKEGEAEQFFNTELCNFYIDMVFQGYVLKSDKQRDRKEQSRIVTVIVDCTCNLANGAVISKHEMVCGDANMKVLSYVTRFWLARFCLMMQFSSLFNVTSNTIFLINNYYWSLKMNNKFRNFYPSSHGVKVMQTRRHMWGRQHP